MLHVIMCISLLTNLVTCYIHTLINPQIVIRPVHCFDIYISKITYNFTSIESSILSSYYDYFFRSKTFKDPESKKISIRHIDKGAGKSRLVKKVLTTRRANSFLIFNSNNNSLEQLSVNFAMQKVFYILIQIFDRDPI